jgi:hypothetical protein
MSENTSTQTTEEPSAHDLEWARTFVETALLPGADQAEAGISILAKLFAEKRREGRNER